jgi:hypothetical protein
MVGLLFGLEDGDDIFNRSVGALSEVYGVITNWTVFFLCNTCMTTKQCDTRTQIADPRRHVSHFGLTRWSVSLTWGEV